jgi:peptidoglycan/LPS O-acetylase OafA/YrhL
VREERRWTRLDGVDVLRAVAICLVVMNHVHLRLLFAKVPYTAGLPRQLVSSLVWNGQRGVQMFFAVSGFLITSITLRRWGSLSRVEVRDFYRLRFARIAPLLLSVLAVLGALHLAQLQDFVVSAKTGGLGRALVAALTLHVNVLEARRGYLPAHWDILWSLSVEEMFYLFFPVVCRLLGGGRRLVFALFAFVVLGPVARTVLAHGSGIWREYSYLGGMDAIALGCLTALLVARHRLSRPALWIVGSLGMAFSIFSLAFSIKANAWGLGRSGLDMTVLALGTCMLITVAAQTEWHAPRILAPFLRLGQRSYEVYLTHMLVVFGLFHLFVAADKPVSAVPALFLTAFACSALLGGIIARFYSEPMNQWLRDRWGDGTRRLGSMLGGA